MTALSFPPLCDCKYIFVCCRLGTDLVSLQDNVIIAIRGQGLVEDDDENDGDHPSSAATGQRVTYALHPNCGIFDEA